MKIQWLGHSCFKMSQDGYDLIIDPYGPQMIPGTIPINEKANQVICSHGHGDHSYVKAVHIEKKKIINPTTKNNACWLTSSGATLFRVNKLTRAKNNNRVGRSQRFMILLYATHHLG